MTFVASNFAVLLYGCLEAISEELGLMEVEEDLVDGIARLGAATVLALGTVLDSVVLGCCLYDDESARSDLRVSAMLCAITVRNDQFSRINLIRYGDVE